MKTKHIFLLAFLILWAGLSKGQQPENILAAVGTPPNPKVPISWNRYNDHTAITAICKKLAAAYPNLVKLESMGKSFQGKELWVMTITDTKIGNADKKPAMYIDGNIHSNEIQGSEFALYTAWYLAEMYGAGNKAILSLLADKTFYIAPTINPDARDNFIHQANTAHSPRSGMIPIDNDRDGATNEDGFDDLDGDGHIVMMRRKSSTGRFKVDPTDSRRMIMIGNDEKGEYELLGSEGIDNDGDGFVNEDGEGAYDPNRDWGWNWQPNYIQGGAFKYPFSLPENRAIVDFVMKHPNIAAAQSYHNNGGMILRGPGAIEDVETYNALDVRVYDALGKKGEEMLPGYKYLVVYKDLYSVFGGELDWFYGGRGIYTFSNELWTGYSMYNKTDGEDSQSQLYAFDKDLLMKDAFVDWHPYRHPQYGDIEIGGFKKTYTRLHPGFLLESDAHRNMAFSIFHAYNTPKLAVNEIEVEAIAGGFTQVTAVVTNDRMIPTHSSQDVKNNIETPDIISLSGGTVVAGMVVTNRDMNFTTEQKIDPANIKVGNIAGNSYVTVRWLVNGGSKFTVTVNSKKGGVASKTN
ncbi:MAG: M14 family metallopeptidase [Pedobacter sp.]|nr:M14 family metallopeptidase [Pedobacter sp.]